MVAPAYVHVRQSKLEPRALNACLLAIQKGSKGYKLWDFNSSKSIVSRHIVFKEDEMFKVAEEVKEPSRGEIQPSS